MTNFSDSLNQAIGTIISSEINKHTAFDKTVVCTVLKVLEKGKLYWVNNGTISFKALSLDNKEYEANDQVYVTIPQGDYNLDKVIMGKYVSNETIAVVEQNFDDFVPGTTIELTQEQISELNENGKTKISLNQAAILNIPYTAWIYEAQLDVDLKEEKNYELKFWLLPKSRDLILVKGSEQLMTLGGISGEYSISFTPAKILTISKGEQNNTFDFSEDTAFPIFLQNNTEYLQFQNNQIITKDSLGGELCNISYNNDVCKALFQNYNINQDDSGVNVVKDNMTFFQKSDQDYFCLNVLNFVYDNDQAYSYKQYNFPCYFSCHNTEQNMVHFWTNYSAYEDFYFRWGSNWGFYSSSEEHTFYREPQDVTADDELSGFIVEDTREHEDISWLPQYKGYSFSEGGGFQVINLERWNLNDGDFVYKTERTKELDILYRGEFKITKKDYPKEAKIEFEPFLIAEAYKADGILPSLRYYDKDNIEQTLKYKSSISANTVEYADEYFQLIFDGEEKTICFYKKEENDKKDLILKIVLETNDRGNLTGKIKEFFDEKNLIGFNIANGAVTNPSGEWKPNSNIIYNQNNNTLTLLDDNFGSCCLSSEDKKIEITGYLDEIEILSDLSLEQNGNIQLKSNGATEALNPEVYPINIFKSSNFLGDSRYLGEPINLYNLDKLKELAPEEARVAEIFIELIKPEYNNDEVFSIEKGTIYLGNVDNSEKLPEDFLFIDTKNRDSKETGKYIFYYDTIVMSDKNADDEILDTTTTIGYQLSSGEWTSFELNPYIFQPILNGIEIVETEWQIADNALFTITNNVEELSRNETAHITTVKAKTLQLALKSLKNDQATTNNDKYWAISDIAKNDKSVITLKSKDSNGIDYTGEITLYFTLSDQLKDVNTGKYLEDVSGCDPVIQIMSSYGTTKGFFYHENKYTTNLGTPVTWYKIDSYGKKQINDLDDIIQIGEIDPNGAFDSYPLLYCQGAIGPKLYYAHYPIATNGSDVMYRMERRAGTLYYYAKRVNTKGDTECFAKTLINDIGEKEIFQNWEKPTVEYFYDDDYNPKLNSSEQNLPLKDNFLLKLERDSDDKTWLTVQPSIILENGINSMDYVSNQRLYCDADEAGYIYNNSTSIGVLPLNAFVDTEIYGSLYKQQLEKYQSKKENTNE